MVIGLRVAEFNLLSYKTLTKLDDRKAKMMAWGNLLKEPRRERWIHADWIAKISCNKKWRANISNEINNISQHGGFTRTSA